MPRQLIFLDVKMPITCTTFQGMAGERKSERQVVLGNLHLITPQIEASCNHAQ